MCQTDFFFFVFKKKLIFRSIGLRSWPMKSIFPFNYHIHTQQQAAGGQRGFLPLLHRGEEGLALHCIQDCKDRSVLHCIAVGTSVRHCNTVRKSVHHCTTVRTTVLNTYSGGPQCPPLSVQHCKTVRTKVLLVVSLHRRQAAVNISN